MRLILLLLLLPVVVGCSSPTEYRTVYEQDTVYVADTVYDVDTVVVDRDDEYNARYGCSANEHDNGCHRGWYKNPDKGKHKGR